MKQYLTAGKVVTTHGIRGEVKVYPYCDSAEMFLSFETLFFDALGKNSIKVERARAHGNMVILKFEDVDTVEDARKFIEKLLYFDRNDVVLEEGAHFIDDLIGSTVKDAETGTVYGILADVTSNGAHDVYHIKMSSGDLRMMPAVEAFVRSVDPETKAILVCPIPGMLED